MSWHFLERWVEKANQHSTLVGKFWITFLIVCRMVIVASVGDRVYNDEQSEFKCNTLQPGCTNVCFNNFSPISHLRFWSFQILFVATPSVMFVVYSAHKAKMKKTAKKQRISNDDDDDEGASGKQISREKTSQLKSMSGRAKSQRNDQLDRSLLELESRRGRVSRNRRDCKRSDTRLFAEDEMLFAQDEATPDRDDRRHPSNEYILPKSTIIRFPQSKRGKQDCYEKRDVKLSHLERSNSCSSNTSGVGSIDNNRAAKRGAAARKNYNRNNCNNTTKEAESTFVWREPKSEPNADEVPQSHRELTDLVVWTPAKMKEENSCKRERTPSGEGHPADKELLHDSPRHGHRHSNKEQTGDRNGNSSIRVMPTAPHEYPDVFQDKEQKKPWSSSRVSLVVPLKGTTDHRECQIDQSFDAAAFAKNRMFDLKVRNSQHPVFAEHFRWYFLSVLLRLGIEVAFVVLQIMLYGFDVPEFYKCQHWPCPNVVDCFISRPMEKTIFLWFMFIYSCLCVVLNLLEVLYLIHAFITKRLRKGRSSSEPTASGDKLKSRYWRKDEKGKLVPCYNHHRSRFGGLHPEEIDMEYDRLGALQSGLSGTSRFGFISKGGRASKRDRSDQSGRFNSGRDFMTMAIAFESEEDREDYLDMEMEQVQAQMEDFVDTAAADQMDDNDDMGGGGDGGI